MEPVTPATAALLSATIRQTAPSIPAADNLGQTGDPRDLYYLLDYLTFAVDRAYPDIPCVRGCSHCCHNQVFRVTEAEWQVVRRELVAMRPDERSEVFARTRALFGAHREVLGAMAELWTAGERVPAELHEPTPKTCPMLRGDGRCGIYDARPAICRGYGYFSATVDGNASLLICKQVGPEWIDQLQSAGIDELPMPNWNPVQRKLEAMSEGGPIKPLPLWLLEFEDELERARSIRIGG
jgi:Fe-S-cluster containining protein